MTSAPGGSRQPCWTGVTKGSLAAMVLRMGRTAQCRRRSRQQRPRLPGLGRT